MWDLVLEVEIEVESFEILVKFDCFTAHVAGIAGKTVARGRIDTIIGLGLSFLF